MTIIDRYLLKQFIQMLLICFFSLAGLYIVIDAFGHLDHFVDYSEGRGSLLAIMGSYYAYHMLAVFDHTSGIMALIAAMFTVTWIQRHHEMTALLAAGISRLRVLRIVLLSALGVGLLAAANREYVMPQIRHHLALDSKNLGGDREVEMQLRWDHETDIQLGGDKLVLKDQRIIRPTLLLPDELALYGPQITAAEAVYAPEASEHPAGYRLRGVDSPEALLSQPSLLLDGRPVVITSIDAPWLAPDELFLVSGISFEFLTGGATWRDFASTAELMRELKSPSTELGADVRVAVHIRFLQPLWDTTLLFLGLPLVISRGNRNPFVAIGLCLAIVTAFMLVALGCQSLGSSGWMRPALAAWFPLMLFVPLAVGLSGSLRS